jgi:peptide/nickel transport system permease protein
MTTDDPTRQAPPAPPQETTGQPVPVESLPHAGHGAWRNFRRRVGGNRGAVIALCFLGFLILVAIVGPWLTPKDPLQQDLNNVLQGPSAEYWLGTDHLGRDIFSRIVVGTRVSLLAVLIAMVVALVGGVPAGFLSGFFGGRLDTVIMRLTDAVMSFPPLLLAIALVGVLGPNLRNAMIAVGIVFAPRFVRLVRGVVLGLKEETYVEASRSIGSPTRLILTRHVFPNTLAPLTVQMAVTAGYAMLAEAGLSFLGLGVQPPDASWGTMIREGFLYFSLSPYLGIFPGIMIAITVFTFVTLGDGLRDALGREERRER